MIRIVIAAVVLLAATAMFMPGLFHKGPETVPAVGIAAARNIAGGTSPLFRSRLDAGANCAELISIRDTFDPQSEEVTRMNEELQSIGCDSAASNRTR